VIRMQLAEWLIDFAIWIMPRGHAHRPAWLEGRERAERLIAGSP